MQNKILYFAYGSNLKQEQMLKRCPDSKLLSEGNLSHYRLNNSPESKTYKGFVSIEESSDDTVNGLIFELSREDLKTLDKFEGYPFVYDRRVMKVSVDGNITKCQCYIASDLI